MTDIDRQAHGALQQNYFAQKVEFFKSPIPGEIQNRTRQLIAKASLSGNSRVLDVGTGVGVLIEHFLECGLNPKNIVGCDLCESMIAEARKRFPKIMFWQGDFVDFPEASHFDAIFFNACFGNFFDQGAIVEKASRLLDKGGKIIISHPLGARFVHALHVSEPKIVPHLLPAQETLTAFCSMYSLELIEYVDEPLLYLSILRRQT